MNCPSCGALMDFLVEHVYGTHWEANWKCPKCCYRVRAEQENKNKEEEL